MPRRDERTFSLKTDPRIVNSILRYWIEHPEAKDTISGIADWWISKKEKRWSRKDVQAAIDELVFMGWVTRREKKIAAEDHLYGLEQKHLKEIARFMRGPKPRAKDERRARRGH